MIDDAQLSPPDRGLAADIVIVGSGPAGLGLAKRFCNTRLSVIVLEAGGRKGDLGAQIAHWGGGAESSGEHPPLHLYRRRVFGGASTVWGGRCVALDPSDLVPQPGLREEAWPIRYDELAAQHPAALDFLDAGACEFEARDALPSHPAALLPDADADLDLGTVERFSRPTNVARKLRGTLAAAPNIRLLLGVTCLEVTTTAGGRATTGVRCRTEAGEFAIEAPTVVLANGGLESVRVLLASQADTPAGLGNERDLVGRHYMTHLTGERGQFVVADRATERELRIGFSRDRVYCQRVIRFAPEAREREGLLNIVFRPTVGDIGNPAHGSASLSAYYLSRRLMIAEQQHRFGEKGLWSRDRQGETTLQHLRNVARHPPEAFAFAMWWIYAKRLAWRRMPIQLARRRDSSYMLQFTSEQVPNASSRLVLSNERDPFGMPRLSVLWQASEIDRLTIARAYRLLLRKLADKRRAVFNVAETEIEEVAMHAVPSGGHHLGGARMGHSPADSVVDRDLKVWGTQGLYVASSAVFPTCGTANPTLTVVALSLRLAEFLAQGMGV